MPENAFLGRLRWPKKLLELAERSSIPGAAKFEARRQYLVALCAAFEIYWRDFLRMCVDESKLGEKQLSHLTKQSFTIAEIATIVGRKITFGELLSYSYRFQSTAIVNRAFSEVFAFDAFGLLGRKQYGVFEVVRKNRKKGREPFRAPLRGKDALKMCPTIDACFKIRHEAVHNLGSLNRVSAKKVRDFEHAMWFFNRIAGMAFGLEILITKGIPNAFMADGLRLGRDIRALNNLRARMGIVSVNEPGLRYISEETIAGVRRTAESHAPHTAIRRN